VGRVPTSRPNWVLARRQEIGHRIARLRAARGLTVDALAEASGLDRKSVLRAENARTSTGIDVLLQLAHGLGVRIGVLLDEGGTAAADGEEGLPPAGPDAGLAGGHRRRPGPGP
jgi:transcriptional regulator with XRE-family HTH domain